MAPGLSLSDAPDALPPSDNDTSQLTPLRSRAGCWTCREKKVKCDETRPQCRRCVRLHRPCDYEPRSRKPYTRRDKASSRLRASRSRYQDAGSPSHGVSGALDSPQQLGPSPAADSYAPHTPVVEPAPEGTPGSIHTAIHHLSPAQLPGATPRQASRNRYSVSTPLSELQPHDVAFDPSLEVSEACAEILKPSDTDAILCWRFILAPSIDRKQPETTVLAAMWKLAKNSPMVLHMICALGAQHSCYLDRQNGERDESAQRALKLRAVEHYGSSLRLLVVATTQDEGRIEELDLILATLWLMLEYEQRFGDGSGSGLTAHLKGAGSILRGRIHQLRDMIEGDGHSTWSSSEDYGSRKSTTGNRSWTLSDFASRIVVWISYKDGAAALNGFGGFFNEALGEALADPDQDYAQSLAHGFEALQKRANRAYSDSWDPQLSQDHLLEDIHSRPLFYLYGNTGQIRFLLSRLVTLRNSDEAAFETSRRQVAQLLTATIDRYAEFLDIAHTLHLTENESHRMFVINVRVISAHYHAAVLCYFRIVRRDAPLDGRQRAALSCIVNIGHQTYADEEKTGMSALAWPLFVAAMETDDALHQTWIMDRYVDLSEQGENYRRAHAVLKTAFSMQRYHERRVDLMELLRNTSQHNRFLI
ncbi:hypothetical protein CC79DRAFT_1368922 [Sarocladium strictum]